jgi:hypothetical protein
MLTATPSVLKKKTAIRYGIAVFFIRKVLIDNDLSKFRCLNIFYRVQLLGLFLAKFLKPNKS